MKDNLVDLTERVFQREGSLSTASSDRRACLTSEAVKNCNFWSCQKISHLFLGHYCMLNLALYYIDTL